MTAAPKGEKKPALSPIDQSSIDAALALVKPGKIATPFRAIDVHPEVKNMEVLRGAVQIVMTSKTGNAVREAVHGSDHAAD